MEPSPAISHEPDTPPLPYPYAGPQPALSGSAFGPLFKALAWTRSLGLGACVLGSLASQLSGKQKGAVVSGIAAGAVLGRDRLHWLL